MRAVALWAEAGRFQPVPRAATRPGRSADCALAVRARWWLRPPPFEPGAGFGSYCSGLAGQVGAECIVSGGIALIVKSWRFTPFTMY